MEKPQKEEILEFEELIRIVNFLVVDKTKEPCGLRPGDSIYFMIYDSFSNSISPQ